MLSIYPHQIYYHVDDTVSLTFALRDSTSWQSVGLARSDFIGSYVEPLYNVLNSAGKIEVHKLSYGSIFNLSYDREENGVTVVFTIESARCRDSGVYIFGNILGDIGAPDKVKITNTSVYVKGLLIRISSKCRVLSNLL